MADDRESACPVDHRARDAWLAQARAARPPGPRAAQCPVDEAAPSAPAGHRSWAQALAAYLPWSDGAPASDPKQASASARHGGLDTGRAVSSIPRFSPGPPDAPRDAAAPCPVQHGAAGDPPVAAAAAGDPPVAAAAAGGPPVAAAAAANNEVESGADASSGNWVYPSEKMFFDAMKRKGYDARAADMKTVVPIHNAVNERAWKEIQAWEAPYLEGTKCAGPKLESFANKKTRMTPTARLNTILGYSAPFDRHDWVVDRCGTRVEYVIDFYAGRPGGRQPGPSFYLDVRPKLNTWEGVKMRAWRWSGMA